MKKLDEAGQTGMPGIVLSSDQLGLAFPERDYVVWSPFDGDSYSLVTHCVKTVLRKARSRYVCYGLLGERDHDIQLGELYRHETGLSCGGQQGRWVGCRLCIGCMDKWLTEIGRVPASPNVVLSGAREDAGKAR